ALSRAVGALELGEFGLDVEKALTELVILRVGQFGLVFMVVGAVGGADGLAELFQLYLGFLFGEFGNGCVGHASCISIAAESVERVVGSVFAGVQAPASNRSAAARASLVTLAPASMRAISSRRALAVSMSTEAMVSPSESALETRSWSAAAAATCGECVMARTCRSCPSRARRSPMAAATAPPTPASASSNTSVPAGEAPARQTLTANAKRAISPPEAIRSSAPKPAPELVSISKATSSRPAGPASLRRMTAMRNFAF